MALREFPSLGGKMALHRSLRSAVITSETFPLNQGLSNLISFCHGYYYFVYYSPVIQRRVVLLGNYFAFILVAGC